MDALRLLSIARKWIGLLLGGMLFAALVAYAISSAQPKTFEAQTTLIVGQSLSASRPDYTGLLTSQSMATTYASIAATRSQLQTAIKSLGLNVTPDDLARRVSASVVPGSALVVITVQDADASEAASIANSLASGLIALASPGSGAQQTFQSSITAAMSGTQAQIADTQSQIATLQALTTRTAAQEATLTALQTQLVTLRSTYATLLGLSSTASDATNTLSVVEPAIAPVNPIGPRTLLNALIGALLGLLAAAGIAALAEYRNDSVGDREQVERLAGGTLLTSVGAIKAPETVGAYPLATVMFPRSGAAEAYRTLRANLEFAAVNRGGLQSVLVTSAQPGEGKTLTAANIAVAYAQAGRRVLLIDADLRVPRIHDVFALPNEVGLTTALVVDGLAPAQIAIESGQPNLWILPSGPLPPNPAELLSSQRMKAILEAALAAYDIVILDSSPLAAVSDAAVLGSVVTGTLLVVDAERGRRRSLHRAREQLTRAGAAIVGVVFNRVPGGKSLDASAQYGGYYLVASAPAGGTPVAAAPAVSVPDAAASVGAPGDEAGAVDKGSGRAGAASRRQPGPN